MASDFVLAAELRTDKGKGASRRLRRNADLVPAILYGAGKDPQPLSIPHKDLYKACESESFYSQIVTIEADGKKQEAILKDLQRHPAKDRIMHADFYRIQMDQEIVVEVPLHFINEEDCPGVKQHNGMVSHNMTQLEISCLPGNLPEYIEVDCKNLDIGDAIHMTQIVLPEGLVIPSLEHDEDHEHDHVVVSVIEQRRMETEDELAEDQEAAQVQADEVPTTDEDASSDSEDDSES